MKLSILIALFLSLSVSAGEMNLSSAVSKSLINKLKQNSDELSGSLICEQSLSEEEAEQSDGSYKVVQKDIYSCEANSISLDTGDAKAAFDQMSKTIKSPDSYQAHSAGGTIEVEFSCSKESCKVKFSDNVYPAG